jgi:hypothetical protein
MVKQLKEIYFLSFDFKKRHNFDKICKKLKPLGQPTFGRHDVCNLVKTSRTPLICQATLSVMAYYQMIFGQKPWSHIKFEAGNKFIKF